jgi:hypothetical protein
MTGIGEILRNTENEQVGVEFNWANYRWPLQTIVLPDDEGRDFETSIQEGQGRAICDGSSYCVCALGHSKGSMGILDPSAVAKF